MGTLIRLTAVLACTIIGITFLMFAVDEMDRGSRTQQNALSRELDSEPVAAAGPRAHEPRDAGAPQDLPRARGHVVLRQVARDRSRRGGALPQRRAHIGETPTRGRPHIPTVEMVALRYPRDRIAPRLQA